MTENKPVEVENKKVEKPKRQRHVVKIVESDSGEKFVRVSFEVRVTKGDLIKLVGSMIADGTVLKPQTGRGVIAEELQEFCFANGVTGFGGLIVKSEHLAKAATIVQFLFPELEG